MAASKLSLFTENTVLINYLIEESNIDETDNEGNTPLMELVLNDKD